MRFLFPYWLVYKKTILAGLLFLAAEAVCDLLLPTIVSRVIDDGIRNQSIETVMRYGGLMLIVALFGACCVVGRSVLASRVSQNFGTDLRLDLYKKINGLSFDTLGKYETASLITRVTNDTSQLVNFTNGMMRIFVKSPLLLLGCFAMVFLLNVKFALILLAVVPLVVALIYASMKIGYPFFARMQVSLDANNAVIREYLSGVRVVKAFNTFEQETARFGKTNTALTDISISAHRVMSVFTPIISLTVNAGVVLALWLARGWVAEQNIMVGQIVAFINYMTTILFSLGMIFMVYQQFIRAKASAERVSEVVREPCEETSAVEAQKIKGGVRFENVTFGYASTGAGATPVLSDINFEIPRGESLGVIGSTGAGKSSLVSLVAGFYPFDGNIFIDGTPNADFGNEALRGQIAFAAQQSILFHGTVADNIRMGKPDATDGEIIEAAKAAQAHEFISGFPDGYETVIGQLGVNLSGGQKQRVSIARALVRKAPILILDDCVSAVDSETERALIESIYALEPKPTTIMITQRISTIINFKYILVLDEGRAAGFGDHRSLMETSPVYREIYESQNI